MNRCVAVGEVEFDRLRRVGHKDWKRKDREKDISKELEREEEERKSCEKDKN